MSLPPEPLELRLRRLVYLLCDLAQAEAEREAQRSLEEARAVCPAVDVAAIHHQPGEDPAGLSGPPASPYLLTADEAAAVLRLHVNDVYNLCTEGRLPHIRIGRRVRIPREKLLAWIDEQVKASMLPDRATADTGGRSRSSCHNPGRPSSSSTVAAQGRRSRRRGGN